MSRYSHPCPACNTSFFRSEARVTEGRGSWFRCPACGEWLQFHSKHRLSIWIISSVLAVVVSWRLGYRGVMLILVATIAAVLLWALGIFLGAILAPAGYKRATNRPSELHLIDKKFDQNKKAP